MSLLPTLLLGSLCSVVVECKKLWLSSSSCPSSLVLLPTSSAALVLGSSSASSSASSAAGSICTLAKERCGGLTTGSMRVKSVRCGFGVKYFGFLHIRGCFFRFLYLRGART